MKIGRVEVDDVIAYITIAIAFVLFVLWWANHDLTAGRTGGLPMDWIWTIVSAALVGGYGVRPYWQLHKVPRFWFAILIWLGIHFTVYMAVFSWLDKVPLMLAGLLVLPEVFLVSMCLGKLFPNARQLERGKVRR